MNNSTFRYRKNMFKLTFLTYSNNGSNSNELMDFAENKNYLAYSTYEYEDFTC